MPKINMSFQTSRQSSHQLQQTPTFSPNLKLNNGVRRHSLSMGMLLRVHNARPGCSACGK